MRQMSTGPQREAFALGRIRNGAQRKRRPGGRETALVLAQQLADTLGDPVALVDDHGRLALANRRLADMFGYDPAALPGMLLEALLPADLQHTAGRRGAAAVGGASAAVAVGAGALLVGRRCDGGTFPVEVSFSQVATPVGRFALASIRDVAGPGRRDAGALAASSHLAAGPSASQGLLDVVAGRVFRAGLYLQEALALPPALAGERVREAIGALDDVIRDVRDATFGEFAAGSGDLAGGPG